MKKIVYQIYISSFKDTNGNGRGDLKGIIAKLDYLKQLGVEYIWITPFFKSPFKDNGYDISNYLMVDPLFGTDEDLKLLIKVAKEKKLKIMLDMVFNHTSIEHEWFKGWINGEKKYQNFYFSKHSVGKPPTNWLSKFGGSAWKEYRKNEWYLHLFDESQADLNWGNKAVRNKLFAVVDYYVKLGIKGFRFDVINLISKDKFEDDFINDGRSKYTDGPRVHEFIKMLAKRFPKDNEFLTVGELSSTSIIDTIKYGNKEKTELDSVFTFHHLKVDYKGLNKFIDLKPDIKSLNNIFAKWFPSISQAGSQMATFLTNHDQPRAVSRFINPKYRIVGAKMLFALSSSLPGIPYIYQGEEIGMTNGNFKTIDDFRDVETLNFLTKSKLITIPKGVFKKSRDNSRTPMQWDESHNSGFSTGVPWIGVNPNFKKINVAKQLLDQNSILAFYKKYISFIKNDVINEKGDLIFQEFKNSIISYKRRYKNKVYHYIFSFNDQKIVFQYDQNHVINSNYVSLEKNVFKPYQFIVLEEKWIF